MMYRISRAKSARERHWKKHEYSLEDLITNGFGFHREADNKDGPAFLPAELIGLERKASAVVSLCALVYDIDGSQTYPEIRDLIAKSGHKAVLYTTYSHKTTKTLIRTDQYAKWAGKVGRPEKHDTDGVKAYLIDKGKSHLKVTMVHAGLVQSADGFNIVVDHEPVDKVRVVLPLASPFVLAEAAYTNAEAVQTWKRTYVGIGKKLGLDFDMACADVTRLHYYPSHPADAAEFKIETLDGGLIDYKAYEMAEVAETRRQHVSNATGNTIIDDDNAIVEGFDVQQWAYNNAKGLGNKLIELLGDHVKADRGVTKEGVHIECPFEDEHTKVGSMGTFLDPGGEDGYPKIHCCHDHCSGRLTEQFIAGMLEQGWFTRDDLVNMGKRAPMESALASIGLDPSTLGKMVSEPAQPEPDDIDISGLGPVEVDEGQRNIVAQIRAMAEKENPLPAGMLDGLVGIRTGIEVKEMIRQSVEKGSEDTRAHAIFCLAVSGMTMKAVKMYYGVYAGDIGLNHIEFMDVVKLVREKVRPLSAKLDILEKASLQNTVLRSELKYLADYYAMPYGQVEAAYEDARVAATSETTKELNRRAAALNVTYAKWQKATDTLIIDLEKTRAEGVVKQFTLNSIKKTRSNEYVLQRSKKGDKYFNVFDYWFNQFPIHTIYDNVIFDPAKETVPANTLNVFYGFRNVTPKSGDASPILDHLRTVWCRGDETSYHWLITYLANIFQQPGKKYPSAVAIIGAQGGGKSLVFEKGLIPMASPYSIVSQRRDDIAGRFNSAMENKLIFVAEETMFAGEHATTSKLKALISGGMIQVERKGFDVESYANYVRFFFLSNDIHSLKLDHDDRRFLVLEIAPDRVGDRKYFSNLANWLDNGGREIWLDYLLKWNPESVHLTWEDLHQPPRSLAKQAQIVHSLSPAEHFFRDLALYGYVDGVKDNDLPMGNIRWLLDSQCYILDKKWKMVWDAYLKAQVSGKQYHKTHLLPTMVTMLGEDGFAERHMMKEAENTPMKSYMKLCSRREALERMVASRYVTQAEYETAVSLGDGDSE